MAWKEVGETSQEIQPHSWFQKPLLAQLQLPKDPGSSWHAHPTWNLSRTLKHSNLHGQRAVTPAATGKLLDKHTSVLLDKSSLVQCITKCASKCSFCSPINCLTRFHMGSPGNLQWAITACSFKLEAISYTSHQSMSIMCTHPRGWHKPLDLASKVSQALLAQEKSKSVLLPMYLLVWVYSIQLNNTMIFFLGARSESSFKYFFTGVLRRHEKLLIRYLYFTCGHGEAGRIGRTEETSEISELEQPALPFNTSQYLNLVLQTKHSLNHQVPWLRSHTVGPLSIPEEGKGRWIRAGKKEDRPRFLDQRLALSGTVISSALGYLQIKYLLLNSRNIV